MDLQLTGKPRWLLLPQTTRRRGDTGDAARGFCFEPATN